MSYLELRLNNTAEGFKVTFISPLGGRGHSVEVPATAAGAEVLLKLLLAQQQGKKKIATEGALTQWQLDELIKSSNVQVKVLSKRKLEENTTLEDLGL